MQENSKIHFIPAIPKREKRVAIYARVSTNDAEQLKSLAVQVSAFTRLVASTPQWLLVDIYMDTASGKAGTARKEFARMLEDCKAHKIEIILTKNISRFGRDTVEILEALNQLKVLGVRVIFEQEDLDTANTDSDLMISIVEAIAQSENESRSENIIWGIKQRAANGSSKLYDRKCYGYTHNADVSLIIDDAEAKNVQMIFNLYLHGKSVLGILKELEQRGVKSPTGKDKWCKRTIDVMLSNEKYTGTVRLLDSGKHEMQYVSENNNPAIISKEMFQAVQIEKAHRSNVTQIENGDKRKNKKYSSKK
ncbi:recombinase family protein [Clostridium sp. JN-1]|jgi:DNA invertase Pin-like site-specific DNA recombinase|uniref:recombinase family protein n=1 Tax=Clostridium sp. JN-1 TaxID=2483110 RepID=UPI000F0B9758|nr:recombinase family protein [Clostridium sp. JN-1]